MAIWETEEIYKHLKVGMHIGYYNRPPWRKIDNDLQQGIITEIEDCDGCYSKICNVNIGIDGRKPDCFMYQGETAIKYVIDNHFLLEEEFRL